MCHYVSALLAVAWLYGAFGTAVASEWTKPLDFGSAAWKDASSLKACPGQGPGGTDCVEWKIDASKAEHATLDLAGLGINLSDYDAIECDFQISGSDAMPVVTIREWPRPKTLSNWYCKIRRPRDQWLQLRYDLRLDDDGLFLSREYERKGAFPAGPELTVTFEPRFLRFAGEPDWRTMRIANLRLIRYPVTIQFDKRQAFYTERGTEYLTQYPITITSRMAVDGTVRVLADTAGVAFFRIGFLSSNGPGLSVPLAAGTSRIEVLTCAIDKAKAESLPPLFAESVLLSASMAEAPEVTMRPLMGYRDWRIWAATPASNLHAPTPEETMANDRAMAKINPAAETLARNAVSKGEALLPKTYEVLTRGPTAHDQLYLCKTCSVRLKPVDVEHHRCPTCNTVYTDPVIVKAYLGIRHGEYLNDVAALAAAYQHSGNDAFAAKAKGILLQYADKYEQIESSEPRSTAAQGKMCYTTLMEAFAASHVFEAWHRIAASPVITAEERHHIEYDFLLNSATRLMRHGAEMNQRAEYFVCFGTAGLYCRQWAIAGEAIYGDQGFLSLFDDGFSDDGIGLEGGNYHRATVMSMCRFAEQLYDQGVNLYTPRFKRVFDASVMTTPRGVAEYCQASYEQAYRIYRNPDYLPTLRQLRKSFNAQSVLDGVPGIPDGPEALSATSVLDASGYLFLRRNTPAGHRCLAINFGMQWDRTELDRLHTRFFVDGKRIDRQIGRITYGSPFAGNMYRSFAHNLVTVDGMDMTEQRVPITGQYEADTLTAALFMTREDAPLYPGVRQWRLVAIAGEHFVVLDHLESATPRQYAWHYYAESKAQQVSLPLEAMVTSPAMAARREVNGSVGPCRRGMTDKALVASFAAGSPEVTLTLVSDGLAEVIDGRIMAGHSPEMRPFLRVTRDATPKASFAALYQIGASPKVPEAALRAVSAPEGVHAWIADTASGRFVLGINTTGKAVTIENVTSKEMLIAAALPPEAAQDKPASDHRP